MELVLFVECLPEKDCGQLASSALLTVGFGVGGELGGEVGFDVGGVCNNMIR